MSNGTFQNVQLAGWTGSPDGRGTIDILSSCIFTIFLCIWSVLCVNIGPPEESFLSKMYFKFKLAVICVIGPDFLMMLAVGQWESARKSCRKFKERQLDGWSMRHAFYADMGGYVVQTSDGVAWPLDANQLFYLIEEGWISDEMVKEEVIIDRGFIDDRNKQDVLVRFLTIAQILWFLIGFVARECQRLAVTTLEITTIGFIVTTIGVSIFWFQKPADIETQRTLDINATVSDVHLRAGRDDTYRWYETPLDFLNPEKTYPEVAWRYCLHIVSAMLMLRKRQPDRAQPIKRRRDDNFPIVSHRSVTILAVCGIVSWGSNLIAWNFDFPTTTEKHLWRACSLILTATVVTGELYQEILLFRFPNMKKEACDRFAASKTISPSKPKGKEKSTKKLARQSDHLLLRLSNISPNGDPSLTIQVRVLLPALFCAAAYGIARLYLLVEDVIAFRGQNPSIYETVDWVKFLPHF